MDRELEDAARDAAPVTISAAELLERRRGDLAEWIRENCPGCFDDQYHLDAGTEARAYWHYGYFSAVKDVLALIGSASTSKH